MKRLEIAAVLTASLALVALLVVLVTGQQLEEAPAVSEADNATTTAPTSTLVNLYYYNPGKDITPDGQLACSASGLSAVARRLPLGDELPERALRQLLSGDLQAAEQADGITTEFPLENLSVVGLTIRPDATAVVALDDPREQTSGGACRVTVLRAQVEKTLTQFATINTVEFLPDSLFQP